MKRRLLSQVLCRQHVCLLCASRSGNAPVKRTIDRISGSRSYAITKRLLQDTARQTSEDLRGEFSMLKQNAGLSFPAREKATVPPRSQNLEQSTPSQPVSNSQRHTTATTDGDKTLNPRSQTPKQAGRRFQRSSSLVDEPDRQSQHRKLKIHETSRGEQKNRTGSIKHDTSLASIRQNAGRAGNTRTSTYRFIPQPSNDVDDAPNNQPEKKATRPQQRTPSEPLRIRRYNADTSTQNGSARRPPAHGMNNASRRIKPEQEDGKQVNELRSVNTDASIERSMDTVEFDAPAGSSFNTFDRLHHRRPPKPDRRARHNDRYDDGSEDVATTTNNTRKSKGRGRNFDFDALEAEEMLYDEGGRRKGKKKKGIELAEPARPTIQLPEFIGVERLAQLLKVNVDTFIKKLEEEGFEGARYDHVLDSGTSAMFADLYGFEPLVAGTGSTTDLVARPPPEDVTSVPPRPPIVTIMGHVDHGKTTILDFFRKSSVVASEHGGITQHIGAFSVVMPGTNRQITFLDTPGHAAFLEMRRRGANVTDIVVLVVAADDSVKPQTIEAIKHSLEANVQIIVAINKIDKPEANVERVKQDLTRHDIVVEDYGGDYQVIAVSGKTGKGMSDLEEAIITLADINDYRAEVDGPVEGNVIESKVTTAGRVATVLVRRGTLRTGDCIVAGTTWARVRTLRNDAGALVTEAPPGTPVQVDGWRGEDPTAGLEVLQAESEDLAKDVVDLRLEQEENMKTAANMAAINNARSEEADARAKVLAWEKDQEWAKKSYGLRPKDNEGWVEADESTGPKKVHFVVKADVAGSVEALTAAVSAIGTREIVTNVIHSGAGSLTESDIRILATTGEQGYAISFNQNIDGNVARLAEAAGLTILDHNIIYKVTDNVKEILAEHLPPIVTQRVLGEAEIGQVFDVTIKRKKVKIAGCRITNGTISRSHKVRVQRGSEIVFTGSLESLKNVKKDVTEMRKGTECGMAFEEWEDFQEGDQVQCFEEHREKRTLY